MRAISTALQLMLLALFVAAYIVAIIPAAFIAALRKPKPAADPLDVLDALETAEDAA